MIQLPLQFQRSLPATANLPENEVPIPITHPTSVTDEATVPANPTVTPNVSGDGDGFSQVTPPKGDDSSGDATPPPMPITQDDDIDVAPQVTDHLTSLAGDDDDESELLDRIDGHKWMNGALFFELLWKTNKTSLQPFSFVKLDFPKEAADYILNHKVGSSDGRYTTSRYMRWARQFNRELQRVIRRLINFQVPEETGDLPPNPLDIPTNHTLSGERLIRRTTTSTDGVPKPKKRRKPGRNKRQRKVKYGVQVPTDVRDAYSLDTQNKNTFWADAIKKEIASLLALDCFEFKDPGYKPSDSYQFCPLTMIFGRC